MHVYDNKDNEPNEFLRKLRYRLFGYGCGWTFWGAFWDWFQPKLLLIILLAVWLYLFLHVRISVVWK
jgi:hypothetical protein